MKKKNLTHKKLWVTQTWRSHLFYLSDVYEQIPKDFNDLIAKGFVKIGTLSEFLNKTEGVATGNIDSKGADYAMIALHMQENAGNEYNGLSVGNGFDIIINATQLNKEIDGFGNTDYDIEAKNPIVVSSAKELRNAVKNGGTVEIDRNVTLSEPLEISDKKVNIRLGDNKFISEGSGHLIQAIGTADVTVSNGTIATNNSNAAAVYVQDSANVNIEKCDITYKGKGGYAVSTNGSTSKNINLTMKDCNIQSPKDYACYFPAGNITLKNCHVKGAVIVSGGDVTIDGGTYIADGFAGQAKIWNKADTIAYMGKFSGRDGCGHMGDSILIMDRRNSGYKLNRVVIKNVTFNTELILKDGTKATAYAIKYIDYNNNESTNRAEIKIENNKYNDKLLDNKNPIMSIGINGSDLNIL